MLIYISCKIITQHLDYCSGNISIYLWSFTSELEVETAQSYTICLEYAHWECAVHVEVILPYATKLHVYFIVIVFINQLEVLYTCFVDTAIEIEDECLYLFIPFWWFIKEEHNIRCFVCVKFTLNLIFILLLIVPNKFCSISIYHW